MPTLTSKHQRLTALRQLPPESVAKISAAWNLQIGHQLNAIPLLSLALLMLGVASCEQKSSVEKNLTPIQFTVTGTPEISNSASLDSGHVFSYRSKLTFLLSFVDAEGFEIFETRAGYFKSSETQSNGETEDKSAGVKPTVSELGIEHGFEYFGSVESSSEKINRIDHVKIKQFVSTDLA